MPNPPVPKEVVLYQAPHDWSHQARKVRQQLTHVCGQCLHRRVRVQTVDGMVYEGIMLGADGCHLHLAVGPEAAMHGYGPGAHGARFWGPFAASSILTLVLYELLVITLLA